MDRTSPTSPRCAAIWPSFTAALFELYGLVESLNVAVRWERSGLYRSRWGNYDLLPRPGVVCVSRGVAVG